MANVDSFARSATKSNKHSREEWKKKLFENETKENQINNMYNNKNKYKAYIISMNILTTKRLFSNLDIDLILFVIRILKSKFIRLHSTKNEKENHTHLNFATNWFQFSRKERQIRNNPKIAYPISALNALTTILSVLNQIILDTV